MDMVYLLEMESGWGFNEVIGENYTNLDDVLGCIL